MSAEAENENEEEQNATPSELDDPELLEEMYHGDGMTQQEIAAEYDVTASTVSHYMQKHGVESRTSRVTDDRLDDPEWLEEQYVANDMTMQEFADEVGCSDGTVMRRIHEFDIPVGSGSDEPDADADADADADESE